MWITSGRRVRGTVPSPSLSHVEHPGDPGSQRSARRSPRPGVCRIARRGEAGIQGDSFAVSAVFAARCRSGAGAARGPARRSAPNSSRGPPPQSARISGRMSGRVPGVSTVIRPLRRARPSTRVRRLSASDTGRVGAAVDAVPMPARRVHEGRAEPAPRCAVDTAPPQACDMGVPKYVGAAQFLVVHSPLGPKGRGE